MIKKFSVLVLLLSMLVALFAGCTDTSAVSTNQPTAAIVSTQPIHTAASNTVPCDTSIEYAISWAESYVGQTTFPYVDGDGRATSLGTCSQFVSNAYGSAIPLYGTPDILWTLSDQQHPGDWSAPRGSLVFFDRNDNNGYNGHVALCTGNGNLIEAGYSTIKTGTIKEENVHAQYLGWIWPPSIWGPGRSVDPSAEASDDLAK
jgi:hypothetical protein